MRHAGTVITDNLLRFIGSPYEVRTRLPEIGRQHHTIRQTPTTECTGPTRPPCYPVVAPLHPPVRQSGIHYPDNLRDSTVVRTSFNEN